MNIVKIETDKNGRKKIFLSGTEIKQVLDFNYERSSANDTTELTLKIVADELLDLYTTE